MRVQRLVVLWRATTQDEEWGTGNSSWRMGKASGWYTTTNLSEMGRAAVFEAGQWECSIHFSIHFFHVRLDQVCKIDQLHRASSEIVGCNNRRRDQLVAPGY